MTVAPTDVEGVWRNTVTGVNVEGVDVSHPNMCDCTYEEMHVGRYGDTMHNTDRHAPDTSRLIQRIAPDHPDGLPVVTRGNATREHDCAPESLGRFDAWVWGERERLVCTHCGYVDGAPAPTRRSDRAT